MTQRIVNPYVPYLYEQLAADAERLQQRYPSLIALQSAGLSAKGRPLTVLKLGSGGDCVLMVGAHHAREYITSAFLMTMCEYYAHCIEHKVQLLYDAKTLFGHVSLYVLPMLNPDGVQISIRGAEDDCAVAWMPRINATYSSWKANANGVDLNRHYPCLFDEKRSSVLEPASEMYQGERPGTEPEVRALMELCEAHPFAVSATLHAKGEEIFYADSNTPFLTVKSRFLARELASLTGYKLMPPSEDPAIYAAGFENWFRAAFQRPSILFETTPYTGGPEPHDMKHFDALIWARMKHTGLCLLNHVYTNKIYNI